MNLSHNRVEILHGVNFDVLERRDPEIYGGLSLAQLEQRIGTSARNVGLTPNFFQTNSETEMVERLHRLSELTDAIIINAGAWTHYSYAIGDALALTGLPAIEVHLSDVNSREDFRRISVFDGQVLAKISGQGPDGYDQALQHLATHLAEQG
ncbi:MAG TPA: type II 3-dehydroquinate dehydratase [Solirubrobacterales bacterium]|nr:type II 3-dehydroquinate dehydratase [Solirubrobacterales bacterium]